MKTKHLVILVCLVIVLGVIYAIQQGARKDAGSAEFRKELVPSDFSSDKVAVVKLERAGASVTLKQTPSGWGVAERFLYPADVSRLRDLFVKICDGRIVQELSLTPAQEKELSLTPETAVTLTLLDAKGKELQRFVFGSEHRGRPAAPQSFAMGGNGGRYLRLADGRSVVVPEGFQEVDSRLTDWLNRDFFQVSDLQRAVLKRNGKTEWELNFKGGKPSLAGAMPAGKELDESKTSSLKSAFSWIRFQDVADPKAAPETTGMDKAPELLLTDSDDLLYTIRPGAGKDGKHYLRISVAWKGEAKRNAPANEKPEDKKRLDAEFEKNVRERREKAEKFNKALSSWTYAVEKNVFDAATGTRASFLKDKPKPSPKQEKKNTTAKPVG